MNSWEAYQGVIDKVNLRFNLSLRDQDLGSIPARRELAIDKIYRISLAKMRGEWTIHDSNRAVMTWLSDIGIATNESTLEQRLDKVLPSQRRRIGKEAFERRFQLGIALLKPNSTIFGLMVFSFFLCIPLAYSFDWFISGLIASACLIGMYLLNRFPNQYVFLTFTDLSEEMRRKHNELLAVSGDAISAETRQSLKVFIDEAFRELSEKQPA